MKTWPDPIRFSHALRDVRLVTVEEPVRVEEERVVEREKVAYERGRQDAEKSLQDQLIRQRTELLELQNGIFASLQQAIPRLARESEKTLVALALEAAQKVVAQLPISAELVEATVREALATIESGTETHISLHPRDLELLQQANSSLFQDNTEQNLHFHPSQEMSRGDCSIRTHFGTVDARRETKFECLKESLQA